MADSVVIKTEEDLLKKQKSEAKELQAKIQKLKHSVPKGDKKQKKEVNAKIEGLESELRSKHEAELTSFHEQVVTVDDDDNDNTGVTEGIENLKLDEEMIIKEETGGVNKKKKSKAEKRKERKQNEELAKQDRIQACDEESLKSARNIEAIALKAILDKRNLMIHEIPSDGNCLYSAIVDQLQRQGTHTSIISLRFQTAQLMRINQDDYNPFLTHPQSGLPLTNEQYEIYCNELESTPAWGGQVEIRALSTLLEQPIEVVQADGPCIHTGVEFYLPPLILSYHRHIFGLGEHFNSIVPKVVEEDQFTTVT